MARANSHYIPNYMWHITQRCHKKDFLLKFSKDKKRWLYWLSEAKKRFGLRILNYAITSNQKWGLSLRLTFIFKPRVKSGPLYSAISIVFYINKPTTDINDFSIVTQKITFKDKR
uniref:Uncharacterized protein n=1 Tax=uncultured bacterium pFosPlaG TaxID=491370 RepID=B0FB25_9BACT|nr:hypothetical protein [uncultured bacterium pFosPlaG]